MVWRGDRHMDAGCDESPVEPEEILADGESDEPAARSLFAAGWFRALLVLTAFAAGGVVALPYLLDWFEPGTLPTNVSVPARRETGAASTPTPSSVSRSVQPVPDRAPSRSAPKRSLTETVATGVVTLPPRNTSVAPSGTVLRPSRAENAKGPERPKPV